MMRLICVLVMLHTVAWAAPAPDWLRNAEVYNGWYKQWTDQAIENVRGLPFVIGPPPDAAIIDKLHKVGTRALCYITLYQMPQNELYQGAKLAEHPEWNVITADGQEAKSCFDSSDNPGWKTVCPNSPGYRREALRLVKSIMDKGADGLFIDNGHPDPVCEGPKFGRHKHIYPGKDNIFAYRELLKAVRALVKGYGEDKVIIVNPGGPKKEWLGACDGQMSESYICTWASKVRWHNEAWLREMAKTWGPLADQGNVVATLSYLGSTSNPKREDAFYCYAWARISGFIWADWNPGDPVTKALLKLRLGKPLGPMLEKDGYYRREFERGVIVVSGESRGASVDLDAAKHARIYDVFEGLHVRPGSAGEYRITLTPGQGRVFLRQ